MAGSAYETLLRGAADASDPVTLAFAGVLSSRNAMRLTSAQTDRLQARFFPQLPAEAMPRFVGVASCDEYDDLLRLLLAHRAHHDERTEWLAHALAAGCFGDDHLWQDMGLPDRKALSALIATHFAALYEKNMDNMKWKKFFYKQLCEQMGVRVCKAPSCKVCGDYDVCFGPEEGLSRLAMPRVA